MIKWEKYVDKIVCINCDQFKSRKLLMLFELKRVGILDSPVFEWQITRNEIYEKEFSDLLFRYNPKDMSFHPNRISCIIGHLDAIRKAYYSGCKSILILEDDLRFLKDLNKIELSMEHLPSLEEYDLILLDKFILNYDKYIVMLNDPSNKINDYYWRFLDNLVSAGNYILNRKAMELIMSVVDSHSIKIMDIYFLYSQMDTVWKKACILTPISIQVIFNNAYCSTLNAKTDEECKKKTLDYQLFYKRQEVNFDDYMMRKDGSKYKYGDYIEA